MLISYGPLTFPGIVSTTALSVQSKAILVFLVSILMQTSYGASQFCPFRLHNRGQGLPSGLFVRQLRHR
jgi:hypothetical protein